MLVVVAAVGGVTGVAAAGLLEYKTLVRLGTLPTIAVGLIEEVSKLIVQFLQASGVRA